MFNLSQVTEMQIKTTLRENALSINWHKETNHEVVRKETFIYFSWVEMKAFLQFWIKIYNVQVQSLTSQLYLTNLH